MEEVENQGSNMEVANPETEATQENTQEISQESSQNDQQDKDWIKRLRRDREDAIRQVNEERKEKELLRNLLSQQMQAASANNSQPEEDIIHELSKEEYVPGEKVAKGFRKLEEKFDKRVQEIEKRYASQHQNQLLNDLRREFPDFEEVVNPETIAILDETNPRLANAIASSKDQYMIAVQTYEYIKAKGISSKAAPSKRARETEAKLEQNKKIVQTPMDKRPMAQAFSYENLNDDLKKSLAAEMYGNARKVGMGY